MKRFLSLLLCLVMCFSVFSTAAIEANALNIAESVFTVESTEFENDTITYTISIAPNQKSIIGAIIKAEFDSNYMAVYEDNCIVGSTNSYGDFAANVTGYYEQGIVYDNPDVYAVAYMNPNGYTIGDTEKKFIQFSFTAISEDRPVTDIKFYCEEYITDDENDENDIRKDSEPELFFEDSVLTLNPATNVEVTSVEGGLKFTWSGATGAEWYNIYRKSETTDWEKIHTEYDTSVTEYTDYTIDLGTKYFYSVEAENSYGKKDFDQTGLGGLNFGVIHGLDAEITERGAIVSWDELSGAESYSVYRQAEGEETFRKIATVTDGTSYEDEPLTSGAKYAYTIKAHKEEYNADTADDPVELTFMAVPEIVFYQLNADNIIINWNIVGGAESYIVYRKAPGEKKYSSIATITENIYTDYDVTDGEAYSYKLRSVNEDGSQSVTKKTGYDLVKIPVTPKVTATVNGDSVRVSWRAVSPAEKYVIWRKTSTGNWTNIASVNATQTAYTDNAVKSGTSYVYSIQTIAEGYTTNQSVSSNSVYYLDTPTDVSVKNNSTGMIITFEKVKGAERYVIYRKKVGGDFEKIGELKASATAKFEDTKSASGVQYVYGVRAVYGDVKSPIAESKVVCYLEPPKITSIAPVYGGINLKWSKVAGAEKYIVVCATNKDMTKIVSTQTVTSTSLSYKKAQSGRNNYFSVQAVCKDNKSTVAKDVVFYLAAPVINYIENTKSSVTIKWNVVNGADKYIVYRKDGSGSFKKIATVEESSGATKLKYVDKKVKSGTTYKYYVKAYDGFDYSPYNKDGWGIKYLSTPSVKCENTYSGLKVTWGKISGAKKYEVYRKSSSSKSWKKIATTSSTAYTDKSAKNGATYYYSVKAVYSSYESYFNTSGCKMKFISAPKLSSATSTKSGITFKWGKVSGASGYYVYRKTGSGSLTKIATVKGGTKVSYVDKTAKKGKTYTYTVKAYSGSYTSGSRTGLKVKDKY